MQRCNAVICITTGASQLIKNTVDVLLGDHIWSVAAVKTIADIIGYNLANPEEVREILGLKGTDKVAF